jgi:hypothetical protein
MFGYEKGSTHIFVFIFIVVGGRLGPSNLQGFNVRVRVCKSQWQPGLHPFEGAVAPGVVDFKRGM